MRTYFVNKQTDQNIVLSLSPLVFVSVNTKLVLDWKTDFTFQWGLIFQETLLLLKLFTTAFHQRFWQRSTALLLIEAISHDIGVIFTGGLMLLHNARKHPEHFQFILLQLTATKGIYNGRHTKHCEKLSAFHASNDTTNNMLWKNTDNGDLFQISFSNKRH